MLVYISHPNTGEENKKTVENFKKENLKKYTEVTFISPIHTLDWQYDKNTQLSKKMNDRVDLLSKCDAILIKPMENVINCPQCLLEAGYAKGISFVVWNEFDKWMKRFDDDFEEDED